MAVTFEKLMQSLRDKKFSPIYFFHGPETYFIDKAAEWIENNALSDSEKSFNQVVFYGKDVDANTILNASTRYPMMSPYQVVIVKEAQQFKDFADLERYFAKPVASTLLVFCHKYKTMDKRLKVYKLLEKNAVLFEAKKIPENKLDEWIKEYTQTRNKKITAKAAMLLAEYTGSDLEKLSSNLDKLIIAGENEGEISESDIEKNIGISREYNVFELSNALANRDKKKISKLLKYILANPKENPFPVIIATLYGFFSKAIGAFIGGTTDKESLKKLGIMEWMQRDYAQAVKSYGEKLYSVIDIIEDFDLRFKGVNDTGTNDGELLKEMVMRILAA